MAGTADLSAGADLPRIALVTDGDVSATSRGAGRTIVNLFGRYPADRLVIATSAAGQPEQNEHGVRVLSAGGWLRGGVAERLRPVLGEAQAVWAGVRPLPLTRDLRAFSPDLVLVVPMTPAAVVWARRAVRALNRPAVTYLMDEWMSDAQRWPCGSAPAAARALLRASRAWLAISPPLAGRMRELAGLERPTLVVHNPVTLDTAPPAALAAPRTGPFRIAYAGSVWPMHFDAIVAVAESAARLRERGTDVRLSLLTDARSWSVAAGQFTKLGVEHPGIVPYAALRDSLGAYDVLLVASSFAPEHAAMSRSSLQTKVTDYLAAGRPILACGPADAASNSYLREHQCAWFAESLDTAAMDAALARCVASRQEGQALAARGYDLVCREHESKVVSDRLYGFLAEAAART